MFGKSFNRSLTDSTSYTFNELIMTHLSIFRSQTFTQSIEFRSKWGVQAKGEKTMKQKKLSKNIQIWKQFLFIHLQYGKKEHCEERKKNWKLRHSGLCAHSCTWDTKNKMSLNLRRKKSKKKKKIKVIKYFHWFFFLRSDRLAFP